MSDRLRIPNRRELPAVWIERQRSHLLAEVAGRPTVSRRRRRFVIALVPAVAVLLAATAFTSYALTREPTHLESIGCYDSVSLHANTAVVSADGRDPVTICAAVWREGALGTNVPKQLQACVLPTGAIGVFPRSSGDACDSLGLASLPAGYAARARQFAALRDAIVTRLSEPASGSATRSTGCVGKEAAIALVRQELDARGYADWQIKVTGGDFTAARPCAEPTFDAGARTVRLVPATR